MNMYVACCLGPLCNLPSMVPGILPSLLGSLSMGRTYIEIGIPTTTLLVWTYAELFLHGSSHLITPARSSMGQT